jgi:LPXTG-site transpeptidase (sortase) family protein
MRPGSVRGPIAAQLVTGAIVAAVVVAVALGAFALRSGGVEPAQWASTATAAAASKPGPPPTRLRIPAIDVDTPLEDLGLDAEGALEPPKNYAKAGWYAHGSRPGDPGPAVIAGHVDSYQGRAIFFRLHELEAGAKVQVERGKEWVTFRVLEVHRYPKNEFPTEEVYGPTPNAQLRLITCGGAFDDERRSYVDNIVVYAVAA